MNLSRCAHCGAVAHFAKSVTDPHLCWSIQCSDCGISTVSYSQQEMAAAAWNRRIPAYSHRNGETEAPTELRTGLYWFRGTATSATCGACDIADIVECSALNAYNDVTGETLPKGDYVGQWWGPVQAPWEPS